MRSHIYRTAAPFLTWIQKLFSEDLARENDYLRQENKILRSKLSKRVPLTERDRRTLVRYGMPLKDRLREVISIVRPETLLAWNRRMVGNAMPQISKHWRHIRERSQFTPFLQNLRQEEAA